MSRTSDASSATPLNRISQRHGALALAATPGRVERRGEAREHLLVGRLEPTYAIDDARIGPPYPGRCTQERAFDRRRGVWLRIDFGIRGGGTRIGREAHAEVVHPQVDRSLGPRGEHAVDLCENAVDRAPYDVTLMREALALDPLLDEGPAMAAVDVELRHLASDVVLHADEQQRVDRRALHEGEARDRKM